MKIFQRFHFFAILFPLTVFLQIINVNRLFISFYTVCVYLLAGTVLALLIFWFCCKVMKNQTKGAYIAVVFYGLLIFQNGITSYLSSLLPSINQEVIQSGVFILSGVMLISFAKWFRKRNIRSSALVIYPNIVTFVLVGIILVRISGNFVQSRAEAAPIKPSMDWKECERVSTNVTDRPDVYYLIFDAYGRKDILKNLYHYDNRPFLTELENRGFRVADQSYSNYHTTLGSLSSSLNLQYGQSLLSAPDKDSMHTWPLIKLIQDNAVYRCFKSLGYETIAFRSATYLTNHQPNVDRSISIPFATSDLEAIHYKYLPRFSFLGNFLASRHRLGIQGIFKRLRELPGEAGPKFVFAHIYIPHPPFVLDENGDSVPQKGHLDFSDADALIRNEEERKQYQEDYIRQLKYTNQELLKTIDAILKGSHQEPIIIVQGDHGPRSEMKFVDFEKSNHKESFAILNAVYLPKRINKPWWDPALTPVNTFRYVLNTVFQTRFEPLENKHYYVPLHHYYDYKEVTDKLH